MKKMGVTFRPPAMGSQHRPIGITGSGSIVVSEDGLLAKGATVVSSTGRWLGALLLLVVLIGAVMAVKGMLGLSSAVTNGLAVAVALGVLVPAMRRPAREGVATEALFPWANIKKIYHDRSSECLVVVVAKMKPKGGLFILVPAGSELEQALRDRLGR